jgi:hypothetical protein
MKTIKYKNGKEIIKFTVYISPDCFCRFKKLSNEMDISMSLLTEKLINNFNKFKQKDV